jgi:recombination protein RecT
MEKTNGAMEIMEAEENRPLSIMLHSPEIISRFELACGREAGSVMINIFNAAAQNLDIWNCEPMSVINAALTAAALDLSLSPALGLACILPFKKWKKNGGDWEVESIRASFVPMKRGLKDLAMRTDKYRVLNSFTLCEGQIWVEDQVTGLGHIEGNWNRKAKSTGYGAYLELFNGYKATDYMSHEEIMEHVVRFSPSWDKKKKEIKPGTKWATDFDMMAEGVVLKRLIRTKGVLTTKAKKVLDEVEKEINGEDADPTTLALSNPEPTEQPKNIKREADPNGPGQLSPIKKAMQEYSYLCLRADAAGVQHEPLPENVTIDQARATYAELLAFVKDAEEQAHS